jgi:hypothetical protein
MANKSRQSVERDSENSQLRSEKLVAEVEESWKTQKKRIVRRWRPVPSNAVKTAT